MSNGNKIIYLDVMVGDRFYCQIPMEYSPLFPIDIEAAERYVLKKKPYLRGTDFTIGFSNERVPKR